MTKFRNSLIYQRFGYSYPYPLDSTSIIVYYITMTLEGLKKPNFDPNLPIYLQIMNFVKKLIVRGVLKPGDKVPSVRDMALFLGVNPNTVQKAYEELERDGTIFTKRGQGNFVNEDKSVAVKLKEAMVKEVIERYKKEMEELGISKEQILILLKEMLE